MSDIEFAGLIALAVATMLLAAANLVDHHHLLQLERKYLEHLREHHGQRDKSCILLSGELERELETVERPTYPGLRR